MSLIVSSLTDSWRILNTPIDRRSAKLHNARMIHQSSGGWHRGLLNPKRWPLKFSWKQSLHTEKLIDSCLETRFVSLSIEGIRSRFSLGIQRCRTLSRLYCPKTLNISSTYKPSVIETFRWLLYLLYCIVYCLTSSHPHTMHNLPTRRTSNDYAEAWKNTSVVMWRYQTRHTHRWCYHDYFERTEAQTK